MRSSGQLFLTLTYLFSSLALGVPRVGVRQSHLKTRHFTTNIWLSRGHTMARTIANLLFPCSLLWALLLSTAALAAPQFAHQLQPRQTCNTATNRQCWTSSPAFNINTDYEASTPSTGVTRTVCSSRFVVWIRGGRKLTACLIVHVYTYRSQQLGRR